MSNDRSSYPTCGSSYHDGVLLKHPSLRLDAGSYKELCRQIMKRDSWRCQICGSTHDLQVHHKQLRSQLGSDEDFNLITLCANCHENVYRKKLRRFQSEKASGNAPLFWRLVDAPSLPVTSITLLDVSYGMWWMLVHLVSAVLISGGLPARSQSQGPVHSDGFPYLLRLQRTIPGAASCVLLRNDGQFHLERTHGDRTKVFEGTLPASKLLRVHRILNDEGVSQLSQENPNSQGTTHVSEILQVSIFRTDHWQNLVFISHNGSQTVPASLEPLTHLLNSFEKQPHQQFNEDESKNNCQSPRQIRLKKRP